MRIKTPAAMARIDRIIPSPPIAGTKAANPVRMSQIAKSRKPIFFVIFIIVSLNGYKKTVAAISQV